MFISILNCVFFSVWDWEVVWWQCAHSASVVWRSYHACNTHMWLPHCDRCGYLVWQLATHTGLRCQDTCKAGTVLSYCFLMLEIIILFCQWWSSFYLLFLSWLWNCYIVTSGYGLVLFLVMNINPVNRSVQLNANILNYFFCLLAEWRPIPCMQWLQHSRVSHQRHCSQSHRPRLCGSVHVHWWPHGPHHHRQQCQLQHKQGHRSWVGSNASMRNMTKPHT